MPVHASCGAYSLQVGRNKQMPPDYQPDPPRQSFPGVTLAEVTATVFVATHHATAECVDIHAVKSGNRFEPLEKIPQGLGDRFGGYAAQISAGLSPRHDHGSAYLPDVFQDELRFLCIQSSPRQCRLLRFGNSRVA